MTEDTKEIVKRLRIDDDPVALDTNSSFGD